MGMLRAEYAHLSEAEWVAGRSRFLESLTGYASLYRTPIMAANFEQPARRNIAASLVALRRG